VELAGQLPIGRLDGLLVGIARHAENLVEVALGAHHQAGTAPQLPPPLRD
jgi:hypothetical protein